MRMRQNNVKLYIKLNVLRNITQSFRYGVCRIYKKITIDIIGKRNETQRNLGLECIPFSRKSLNIE